MENFKDFLLNISFNGAKEKIDLAKRKYLKFEVDIEDLCDLSLSAFLIISEYMPPKIFENFYNKFKGLEENIREFAPFLAKKVSFELDYIHSSYYPPF